MLDFIDDVLIDDKFCDKLGMLVCVYQNPITKSKKLVFSDRAGYQDPNGYQGDGTPFVIFSLMGRLLKHCKVSKVISAGLGTGSIGKELNKYGIQTTYIEISPVVEQMWRKHFNPIPTESVILSDINDYLRTSKDTTPLIVDCYGNGELESDFSLLERHIAQRDHIVINCADLQDDLILQRLSKKYNLHRYIRSGIESGRYIDCDNIIYSDIQITDKLYEEV